MMTCAKQLRHIFSELITLSRTSFKQILHLLKKCNEWFIKIKIYYHLKSNKEPTFPVWAISA